MTMLVLMAVMLDGKRYYASCECQEESLLRVIRVTGLKTEEGIECDEQTRKRVEEALRSTTLKNELGRQDTQLASGPT